MNINEFPQQVNQVISIAETILQGQILGIYLYGSATMNGLRPDSDIDILIITKQELSNSIRADLTKQLLKISGSVGCIEKRPLEVTIINQSDIVPLQFPPKCQYMYGEWLRGEMEAGEYPQACNDPDIMILLWQARKNSITLKGAESKELIPAIPFHEIKKAIRFSLPGLISSFKGDERNVLLTLSRMWFTLVTEEITTKDVAAKWVILKLPERFPPLLTTAKEAYLGNLSDEWETVEKEAMALVEYMKKQIEECTSPDKLNELKYEYDMYNAKFGQTEDLYSTFANKNVELEGTPTITQQKPKSKLITDTAFDSNLQNLNLKKYGKQGIPLKYSHDNFMKDLKKQLDSLPENERNAVMADLNIKFQQEGSKFELVDIPNLSAKAKTDAHKNVLDILNKYAKQNEIQLPDPIMNSELQKFIKDVPEFTFMIGKPQNGVHSYSLDSHTLQNLQKALKYADEANLAQESKEILKMSILLHDMGKQFKGSGVSDTGHSVLSKKYAEKILERFDYPQSTKDKILNLIENHHWFKEYCLGNTSKLDIATLCRRPQVVCGDDTESQSAGRTAAGQQSRIRTGTHGDRTTAGIIV